MNGLSVGFPPAVHLLQGAVAAGAADRGPDADLRAREEHVGGDLQRDGAHVVAGEVVVPGPGEAVQGPLDVGEERVAAPPGQQPNGAGLDRRGHAVEVDRERLGEHLAGRLGLAGLGPVAYQAVPVCLPPWYWEKVKVNATSAC